MQRVYAAISTKTLCLSVCLSVCLPPVLAQGLLQLQLLPEEARLHHHVRQRRADLLQG